MRLGKGESFGTVVVGLPPNADPNPPSRENASSGLDIPDDPSQPVRTNEWRGIVGYQLL